jgi:hypothetical protein
MQMNRAATIAAAVLLLTVLATGLMIGADIDRCIANGNTPEVCYDAFG